MLSAMLSSAGSRLSQRSLKHQLMLMVLLAMLPLVATRLAGLKNEGNRIINKARQQAQELAVNGVARSSDVVEEVRASLEIIAQVPSVLDGASLACSEFMASVASTRSWAAGLHVINPAGKVTCSSAPENLGLNVIDRPYVQTALARRGFFAGDFIIGRLSRKPMIGSAMPIYNPAGELQCVVVATIAINWFDKVAEDIARGIPGSTVTLIDGRGVVLADAPAGGNIAGEVLASPSLRRGIIDSSVTSLEAPGDDDQARIFGLATMPHTHARLLIGLSKERVLSDIVGHRQRMLIELVLMCVVMGGSLWLFGNYTLAHPIRQLLAHAGKVRRGRLDARLDDRHWPRELALLARSFNQMTKRLQRDNADQMATQSLLRAQSLSDPLTGIANRRAFDLQVRKKWEAGRKSGTALALIMLDADHFKQYNDCYGHAAGDAALLAIANVLAQAAAGHSGFAARIGGEEFAVLLADHGEAEALVVADGICADMRARGIRHVAAASGVLSLSAGVSSLVAVPGLGHSMLAEAADSALYAAKAAGRDRAIGSTRLQALAVAAMADTDYSGTGLDKHLMRGSSGR
jgi:diguanylate cyclase (GGDEF)-like protein